MSVQSSFREQRDRMETDMAAQAPAELLDGFASAAERLDEAGFASRAPGVGEAAPDFELPDQNGERVALSAVLRAGPVVLVFYRGEWCPYCNLQLRAFQSRLDEFAANDAQLVAISIQTPDHSLSMAEKNDLAFPVLSDVGGVVVDRYGLRYEIDERTRVLMSAVGNDISEYNGAGEWRLSATATFLLDRDGIVRYANVRGDWRERAEVDDVLAAFES